MASESDDISRYEIFIDEAATSDISAIYEYLVENADIQIAEKQGGIIFTCIEKLDVFPNGHPVFDSSLSLRVAHTGKYKIIFRVNNEKHTVIVARIFHAKQKSS